MFNKTGKRSTWWKPVVALGVSWVSWSHLLPVQLFSLLCGWMRVGETRCALPSKIALKERVGWFIALPHLSGHAGNPLVDAHAEVCFLVAVRMSGCSNRSCCWCCCSWSLLKLLFFPDQSLTPLSLSPSLPHPPAPLSCPLHCHSYNSGCWLNLCSKLSFVFCSSRSLAFFFFFHADFRLSPPSVRHRLTVSKATGKKEVCSFLYTEKEVSWL